MRRIPVVTALCERIIPDAMIAQLLLTIRNNLEKQLLSEGKVWPFSQGSQF